jgi:SAM-dependent methyltransferase
MNNALVAVMPASVVMGLKKARNAFYQLIEPLDYLLRVVNEKNDFPPIKLRRYVGPLRGFESSGAEFTAYMKLLGGLRSDERVLDIGCGCGLMAIYLREYLTSAGSYAGVDIYKPAVQWSRKNIVAKNITFAHIDVQNDIYNQNGAISDKEFTFPYDTGSVDLVLTKSVFTHMQEAGIRRYLGEIKRLLSDHGRAIITLFLLNKTQKELFEKGLNRMKFVFGNDTCRWLYKNSPESGIAYSEEVILKYLAENNLELLNSVYYGTWSGRENGTSFQDIMVIRKIAGKQ